MTVREHVRVIQRMLASGQDLPPSELAQIDLTLSGLLGYVIEECRTTDLEYKRVLLEAMRTHEKANRARIEAETSDAYAAKREAEGWHTTTLEMLRSVRSALRSSTEEARLAR